MRHEKVKTWQAGFLVVGITLYSAWQLLGVGVLSWHIRQPEFIKMLLEFLAVWLVLFLLFFYGTSYFIRITGLAVLGVALAWVHTVFLPVVLAGIYTGYLIMGGKLLGNVFLKRTLSIPWAFTAGSAVTVTVFCLMSLAQLGSIEKMRLWVFGSGAIMLVCYGTKVNWKKQRVNGDGLGERKGGRKASYHETLENIARLSLPTALVLAAIGSLWFLQMGRMNVAVDFDSIWYGVRSHLMLDSGNSIYENLGTLGIVYTYPKGWEVLTLPLAGLPSYSFPIAFNLWIAALVLLTGYQVASTRMEGTNALWVPFLMAAVPSIMNMACTAKADLITLLFQLLMIHSVLQYDNERQAEWLVLGVSAAIFSLTMKPTAVIYSTAVGGMTLIWVCWDCRRRRPNFSSVQPVSPQFWLALLPSMAALAGIWGRTLKLVGVPVTSVFYGLFQKLGFTVKYPFYATGFPSSSSWMTLDEKLRFMGGRLYGILINPQGGDMEHVIIAWGTALPLILLIVWLCMRTAQKMGRDKTPGYLPMLTIGILAVNLASLYSLSQIDGNYYMLFYALVILDFCLWGENLLPASRRASRLVLLPAWVLAVLLCSLTNWSWALGNGGIHLKNAGYFDHTKIAKEQRSAQGSGAIWNILATDPQNRVIALGELPSVLTFPCTVQSYIDVSGYWGNPEVVANVPNFLQYLLYADIDYLYMEKGYVCQGVRIYDIIRELVSQGWLWDVRGENGNLILSVKKDGPDTQMAQRNLEAFDHHYIQHP